MIQNSDKTFPSTAQLNGKEEAHRSNKDSTSARNTALWFSDQNRLLKYAVFPSRFSTALRYIAAVARRGLEIRWHQISECAGRRTPKNSRSHVVWAKGRSCAVRCSSSGQKLSELENVAHVGKGQYGVAVGLKCKKTVVVGFYTNNVYLVVDVR